MTTILLVEDETAIADLVSFYLLNEGMLVVQCATGAQAEKYMYTEKIDLAILDIMLPDTDGFTLCQKIRAQSHYPIIFLSAKTTEFDKINGLILGADDYMTKPFKPLELIARVKAQLRRATKYNQNAEQQNVLNIRGLEIDLDMRKVSLNGQEIVLTPTEFKLLTFLCEHAGKTLETEMIFQSVWQEKYFSNSANTVMVHIRHLREKFSLVDRQQAYIKTIWGVGYKIE